MFDLTVNYLSTLVQILVPCVFLRMVLDSIRNNLFKN